MPLQSARRTLTDGAKRSEAPRVRTVAVGWRKQMSMADADTRAFIAQDLYYELRCLLGAATVWRAFKQANAGFDDDAGKRVKPLFVF